MLKTDRSFYRSLGPGGPLVPPLGLGSWHTWDRMSRDDAVEAITLAIEHNAGLFDIGAYTSGPHLDEMSTTDIDFGAAFRASGVDRDDATILAKIWLWDWPGTTLRQQAEDILERTGFERFDAIVLGAYPATPDIAGITTEMSELIRDGIAASWGVNNWIPADVETAIATASSDDLVAPIFAQLKYGIARRSMGEGANYSRLFRDGRLSMQASDLFEGGILAGKLRPTRRIGLDDGGIRDQIIEAYPAIERISATFGATTAEAAIAFCLAYEHTSNVLFGASTLDQLRTNLNALELATASGQALRAALDEFWLDRGAPAGWIQDPADGVVAW